jgi:hypothetical protein
VLVAGAEKEVRIRLDAFASVDAPRRAAIHAADGNPGACEAFDHGVVHAPGVLGTDTAPGRSIPGPG